MKRLRFWFVCTCTWFFLFYNVERLGEPINLASFVYVYAFILAVLVLLIPALQQTSFVWVLVGALVPYFLLKSELGYSLTGADLPIIVTEICALGITIFLAGQLGRHIEGVKEVLASLTIGRLGEEAVPFSKGQERIYSEIRRARMYERPATLLAISATQQSIDLSIDSFIKEAQGEIIKQYITARVSELLVEELQDCDIVARRNKHFITLLPETTKESVGEIIARIEEKASKELKLKLNVGWATFPDEAVTFESLLSIAEGQMTTNTKKEINRSLPGISTTDKKIMASSAEDASVQSIS